MYTEQIDQNAPFSENMFFNFPCKKYACNPKNIADIQNNYYDLIYVCSWHVRGYRDIARSRKGKAIRILCMDNQWMGTARQYIGIAAFRLYVRSCYDFAFVPGNRQAKFASYLGFGAHEIIEGHYACAESFTSAAQVVAPRAFLFVGRLIDLKGVNVTRLGLADLCSTPERSVDPANMRRGSAAERLRWTPLCRDSWFCSTIGIASCHATSVGARIAESLRAMGVGGARGGEGWAWFNCFERLRSRRLFSARHAQWSLGSKGQRGGVMRRVRMVSPTE